MNKYIFSLRRNPGVETGDAGDVYALQRGEEGGLFLTTIREGPDIKLAGYICAQPDTRNLNLISDLIPNIKNARYPELVLFRSS